jgi:uncharacterized protein YjbI with pentapeptide repeats
MSNVKLDTYQRGIRNLLARMGSGHARSDAVRALHQRLIDNLTEAQEQGDSLAQVAERADILDRLNRITLDLTGRSFETLCEQISQPTPLIMSSKEYLSTLDEYLEWMKSLLPTEKMQEPVVCRFVQARTHQLLPKLTPAEKGELVQFLYDAVLLSKAMLTISLADADLSNAKLVQVDLTKGNLLGANLKGANLSGATLTEAILRQANLALANLSWALLGRANLEESELGGATLTGADLRESNLQDAHMVKVNLRRADLTQAQMAGANLLGANLEEAILTVADLSSANLLWASFERARLDGVKVEGATYNQHTHWPPSFDPQAQGAVKID